MIKIQNRYTKELDKKLKNNGKLYFVESKDEVFVRYEGNTVAILYINKCKMVTHIHVFSDNIQKRKYERVISGLIGEVILGKHVVQHYIA